MARSVAALVRLNQLFVLDGVERLLNHYLVLQAIVVSAGHLVCHIFVVDVFFYVCHFNFYVQTNFNK